MEFGILFSGFLLITLPRFLKGIQVMQYAIVDIETTGGAASSSGITEIAIVLHDGQSVTGRYSTLINPQRAIPAYITSLTGISMPMVANSPTFEEVASNIYALLQGKVFVAHNVNFDYSFIKHHLSLAGYELQVPKLCTVRMSRKIFPGFRSYSLGTLCRELDIPIHERHRAGGDADATVLLFEKLLLYDSVGHIAKMLKKGMGEQQLPANLPIDDITQLPSLPGVYYFKDNKQKVIYVGKAINLQKRVKSHFSGHNPNAQRQNFLRRIHSVTYEVCGTELMAFVLEAIEIKRLWPEYNRVLKKYEPKFGLFAYEGLDGLKRLAVDKYTRNKAAIEVFHRLVDGTNLLHHWINEYSLCKKLCHIGVCDDCDGNCTMNSNNTVAYNVQAQLAIDNYLQQLPSYFIVDEGRHPTEQSVIWVEKGKFYGMGYVSIYADMDDTVKIKSQLKRYTSNFYILQLIQNFADANKDKILNIEGAGIKRKVRGHE